MPRPVLGHRLHCNATVLPHLGRQCCRGELEGMAHDQTCDRSPAPARHVQMDGTCLAVIALFIVAACESPQEIAARQQAERQAYERAMDNRCRRGYGAEPGSPAYTQCRVQMDQMNQQAALAQAQMAQQSQQAYAAQQAAQQQAYQQRQADIFASTIRPTVNCRSRAYGNTVNANCQ